VSQLHLGKDLYLPVDAATQTFLNIGKRGSGKTNTAARLVEQFHKARVPFIVLDPVDSWWGLKAGKDGGPGLSEVYLFGGRRQELPLEAGGGTLIAETVCEHRISVVLSCKHLSGRERSRFMTDFARTLFQKWTGGPLHLVLEEAHELAPQSPYSGEEEMLGAFKRLWKLGRSSGIGGTAVTQRPAALHKDITTQAEILVVHRTIGPQDVEAVRQWIKYHSEQEKILPELAGLKAGEAFFWAPDFPEDKPIGLVRVKILQRQTFDSAATPKHGEKRAEPKALAESDLKRLRDKMAATIERAKAEDPRELKAKVRDLEQRIRQAEQAHDRIQNAKRVTTVVKPILKEPQIKRLEAAVDRMRKATEKLPHLLENVTALAGCVAEQIRLALLPQAPVMGAPLAPMVMPQQHRDNQKLSARVDASNGNGSTLTGPERKILTALAQHGQQTLKALALLSGYAVGGGAFRNPLSSLRSKGYVSGRDMLSATPAGTTALGTWTPLPQGRALLDYWLGNLGGPERKILRRVADAYPHAIHLDNLAADTNYAPEGGAFRNPLSRLRTLQLITGKGEVRAAEEFFQ
jgi:hypothetical protein